MSLLSCQPRDFIYAHMLHDRTHGTILLTRDIMHSRLVFVCELCGCAADPMYDLITADASVTKQFVRCTLTKENLWRLWFISFYATSTSGAAFEPDAACTILLYVNPSGQ